MDIPVGYYYAAMGAYYKMAAVLADIGAADVLDSMLPVTQMLNAQLRGLRDESISEEELKAFCEQSMQQSVESTAARNKRLEEVLQSMRNRIEFIEYLKARNDAALNRPTDSGADGGDS